MSHQQTDRARRAGPLRGPEPGGVLPASPGTGGAKRQNAASSSKREEAEPVAQAGTQGPRGQLVSGAPSPVPLAGTASAPPVPAAHVAAALLTSGGFRFVRICLLLVSNSVRSLHLPALLRLVPFLGKGTPHLHGADVCRDFCWGRCSSAGCLQFQGCLTLSCVVVF